MDQRMVESGLASRVSDAGHVQQRSFYRCRRNVLDCDDVPEQILIRPAYHDVRSWGVSPTRRRDLDQPRSEAFEPPQSGGCSMRGRRPFSSPKARGHDVAVPRSRCARDPEDTRQLASPKSRAEKVMNHGIRRSCRSCLGSVDQSELRFRSGEAEPADTMDVSHM